MKNLILIAILLTALSATALASEEQKTSKVEAGALFKNGQGLSLSKVMAESIKLETTEVTEESMTPVLFAELQSYRKGKELTGWVKSEDAARLKKGYDATLKVGAKTFAGKVRQISKSSYAAGGDYEITVQANEDVTPGTPVNASFATHTKEGALVVPKSSVLTTAEGKFVYAKSGDFYVRTPVKIGSMSNDKIQILDGLYSGDEVVTNPVMRLWLAELQAIRGGQSCADGH